MAIGILLVDPQNDFFPGGALGVKDGDQIVEPINRLLEAFPKVSVFVSRDWHPSETKHFAAGGGLWPPHCVQGTQGAEFHSGLKLPPHLVVTKGENPEDDGGYSAFDGTIGLGTPLLSALRSNEVDTLIIAGLATDYCVKATVLDALKNGFQVLLFRPGIRAVNINEDDSYKALVEMRIAGVFFLE